MQKTLFDKLWERHVITGSTGEAQLLYIDLHLIHEVTSPQAFEGLREKNRSLRKPKQTYGTMDHNVPTKDIFNIQDVVAKKQLEALANNAEEFGVTICENGSENQGIIHMVGPESGLTQPGKTVVCGDSHTATHGAFGALAFGIGTSEVEHVFATQTLWQVKPKQMNVAISGKLQEGVYAKDIILGLIATFGVDFGVGYAVEFAGEAIEHLSMEERMTICNMAIEGGAKMGFIAPDQKTFDYVRGKAFAPIDFEEAVEDWQTLPTEEGATFDKVLNFDVTHLKPVVTWGTNPEMAIEIDQKLPEIKDFNDERAYEYMDLKAGQRLTDIEIGYVFLGSCTNGRLSDLKIAAEIVKGKKVHENVTAIVVSGSRPVKIAAEKLGLDKIFQEAGFEWRDPGCSMCLGMNPDQVPSGIHCASTSNRNFEGRQGKGSRTHLCSPAMAATAAIHGKFIDITQKV